MSRGRLIHSFWYCVGWLWGSSFPHWFPNCGALSCSPCWISELNRDIREHGDGNSMFRFGNFIFRICYIWNLSFWIFSIFKLSNFTICNLENVKVGNVKFGNVEFVHFRYWHLWVCNFEFHKISNFKHTRHVFHISNFPNYKTYKFKKWGTQTFQAHHNFKFLDVICWFKDVPIFFVFSKSFGDKYGVRGSRIGFIFGCSRNHPKNIATCPEIKISHLGIIKTRTPKNTLKNQE